MTVLATRLHKVFTSRFCSQSTCTGDASISSINYWPLFLASWGVLLLASWVVFAWGFASSFLGGFDMLGVINCVSQCT